MMPPSGLVAEDIVVRFGGRVALDHAGVSAAPGQITALIGPNGAGKTTLFNVCCGFQGHVEGRVLLDGVDVSHVGAARRARLGIGRTFQRLELFWSLTVRENIALAGQARGITDNPLTQLGLAGNRAASRRDLGYAADAILDRVGLSHLADRLARELSTGEARLLELGRALAGAPRVLLLDEPSSGLDSAETTAFGDLLTELATTDGLAVLLVEHDMNLVLRVAALIFVLDFGKPLITGTPAEIRKSAPVRAAYLGQQAEKVGPTRDRKAVQR
jgi:ABC-type branched-subunit amino acid transport system ATPase component